MKLTEIWNSSQIVQLLSPDQLDDFLKEHCSNCLSKKIVFHRGTNERMDDLSSVCDSRRGADRVSLHAAGNFYTAFLEHEKDWSAAPRHKSFICSTDREQAGQYGNVYDVYPFDDAVIGICPAEDFQWSFDLGDLEQANISHLAAVNHYLINETEELLGESAAEKLNDPKKVLDILDQIETKILQIENFDGDIMRDIKDFLIKNKPTSVRAYFSELFNFKKNGFELSTGKNLNVMHGEVEVWIYGKAVFVEPSHEDLSHEA